MPLYFDGYCPESLLQGKQVEMRLNQDDFWESEATGLQITVFPPFAAILGWRGSGRFRQSGAPASDTLSGLLLCGTRTEPGKEVFPDEQTLLHDAFHLECYLTQVAANKAAFDKERFNPKDPVLAQQAAWLATLPPERLHALASGYENLLAEQPASLHESTCFEHIHQELYDLKLVFNFNWQRWHEGQRRINDPGFDCTRCPLLEVSMYLTLLFRGDRFDEGLLEHHFRSGTLGKLFRRLKA